MVYEPKILFNPFPYEVEFMRDRKIYKFKPYENRPLDGVVAYHALNMANCGLVEYDPKIHDDKVKVDSIDYSKMPWKRLVSLGSERGVFKPGMQREELEKALDGEA